MGTGTPITINVNEITNLATRLKVSALGGEDVMYGERFVDAAGATLPADAKFSSPDFTVHAATALPSVETVQVSAGTFAPGGDLAEQVTTVAPAVFGRLMKLRDRLNQYGLDLEQFLVENQHLEDLNHVSAATFQESVTFYDIVEEEA